MEPIVHLKEIRSQIERTPFRPFRICTSDGAEHNVLNPKFVLVTRHTVYVGIPEDAEDVPEHTKIFDTMHITRVEPIREEPPSA